MIRLPLLSVLFFLLAGLLAPAWAAPKVLYEKPSPFGLVIVTEEHGLRTLWFEKGGARQSVIKPGDPEHLELPYASVAFTGLALCRQPDRVLVVGLGGGTLPMFLRRHYPAAAIDAVDINPDVVAVAREFLGFRDDKRLQAHVADGRAFIEKTRQPYDVIFLDAFGSDSVPPSLTTREFLHAVRRAVRPDGVVIGNIWDRASNPLYDSMVRTYQEVFDDLYILPVRGAGNIILLALPRDEDLSRDELARRARRISNAGKFRFDLGEKVGPGFLHATEKKPEGRVLLDADLPARE
ncbi:MAG: methyltransferase domain-containing protein [Verrucomicrobia bacterium]|nr:methyltransferase domain-containing protein [Verrucomicrobiota bacterium]